MLEFIARKTPKNRKLGFSGRKEIAIYKKGNGEYLLCIRIKLSIFIFVTHPIKVESILQF
jgi:hypothetical protein